MTGRRSGREIRAAVRAQLEAQMQAREEAALSVAAAWDKVSRAAERLAVVEREAATDVAAASQQVSLADLSELADVPVEELRRLLRSSRASTGQGGADAGIDEDADPAAVGPVTDAGHAWRTPAVYGDDARSADPLDAPAGAGAVGAVPAQPVDVDTAAAAATSAVSLPA